MQISKQEIRKIAKNTSSGSIFTVYVCLEVHKGGHIDGYLLDSV
jgi:hypothetical protein